MLGFWSTFKSLFRTFVLHNVICNFEFDVMQTAILTNLYLWHSFYT